MEDEEARLKALLERTEDFDERRKIRAELRTVRKKMLDALSANAEAESNERAARRAERARARKAEDANTYTGPAITDKILSEMDDEETLQTLLNEIPTSQIEDRRRIRARIREVKRNKEESESTSRHTRRTRETTEPSDETTSTRERRRYKKTASDESIETKRDEPSSVTIESNFNGTSDVSITTKSDETPSVTIETKDEDLAVTIETKPEESTDEPVNGLLDETVNEVLDEESVLPNSDEPADVSVTMSTNDPETVTIETTSTSHVDDESEIKFKLTLRQAKDIQTEQDTEDSAEQLADMEIDQAEEEPSIEPVGTPVEIKIEHIVDQKEEVEIDNEDSQDVVEDVPEVPNDKVVNEEQKEVEVNGQIEDENLEENEGISVEFKVDEQVNLSIDTEENNQDEVNVPETEEISTTDGGQISKDKRSESNVSTTSSEGQSSKQGSCWPTQNDKKKPGKVNQVDFRNNLKKSGKISQGKGVVNLEKKTSTHGAQVDFRSSHLKKSGRIGGGSVNLENKVSTQGAQVDFRSGNLKSSGKIGSGVVHLERKNNTTGAQVDFRGALKKGGSPSVKAGSERKGSVKSETPSRKDSLKSEKTEKPTEKETAEPKQEEVSEVEKTASEENMASEIDDKPSASIKVTLPASDVKKAPVKEPKPVVSKNEKNTARNEPKTVRNEAKTAEVKAEATVNGPKDENISTSGDDKDNEDMPAPGDIKFDLKIENIEESPAPSKNNKETTPARKEKEVPEAKGKAEFKYKPRDSYKTRENTTKNTPGGKNKLFDKMSKFQAKDETAVKPKGYTPRSSQKKETAPAEKAVNGLAVKVENTTITEPESPVQIEVSEHVEDDGDTHTEIREEKTTKEDGEVIEEKKEVKTTTTKPGGAKITTQTKETKTTTKRFMDPELQKRMAQRQKDRFAAKKEQAASAKNKRMAFMQKLEANSPAQKGPSNVKRSGSNVDKLLAWCRFKLRDYEGVKLNNFSSSWADGLAFCALLHLYLPEKIPYEELLAGGDKKRNFETAFSTATEAGVPELLEVEDMLSVANPEPKSVMTYVSSIYKHFNPS